MKLTKEDKTLLLKDLYARMPYGRIKVEIIERDDSIPSRVRYLNHFHLTCFTENRFINEEDNGCWKSFKPYLRPMSSMTEEEKEEYIDLFEGMPFSPDPVSLLDWLNAHHFDYRGLIEKGLALEAPDDMYK